MDMETIVNLLGLMLMPLCGRAFVQSADCCSVSAQISAPFYYIPRMAIQRSAPKLPCDWKMVFKAVARNSQPVMDGFLTAGGINENSAEAWSITSTSVFRDGSILDNWARRAIERVRIELYKDGERKAWFLYNAVGSTIDSWMSKDRLIASPYKETKDPVQNFHSINGDQTVKRPFFINRNYGGCPNDCGFMMTLDVGSAGPCSFDSLGPKPYFLYGLKTDSCSNWESGQYEIADRLVVFVKECPGDTCT